MAETLAYCVVILILGAGALWILDRQASAYIRALTRNSEADQLANEVALVERRNAVRLAEQTLPEEAELRRAELILQAAQAKAAAARVALLQDDQTEADRQAIQAIVAAKKELAPEYARKQLDASLESAGRSPVEEYAEYLESTTTHGVNPMDFEEFVAAVRSAR